jgi:hypothetical protein
MVMMAITHAKMGRSMKKRESMRESCRQRFATSFAVPPACMSAFISSAAGTAFTGETRLGLLQSVDDHAVAG